MNSVADRDRALAAFKKRFAEKVKALRAERRLTLEEFSSPTPYSGQTISNYIRKPDAYMTEDFIEALCRAYPEDLAGEFSELQKLKAIGMPGASSAAVSALKLRARRIEIINEMKGLLDELARMS